LDIPGTRVDRIPLVADLTTDFLSTVEFLKERGQLNYTRFCSVSDEFHVKLNSIASKSAVPKAFWEGIRKYFYATVIAKIKEELFGTYLRERAERKKEEREYWRGASGFDWFGDFMGRMFHDFVSMVTKLSAPFTSLNRLGLGENFTEEDLNITYRRKALLLHPDKGGDEAKFKQLVEDKNKCLVYLRSRTNELAIR